MSAQQRTGRRVDEYLTGKIGATNLSLMDALRKLILDELAKQKLSLREAAARSEGLVSHSTLGLIAQGRHSGNLTDKTLAGIALALNQPVGKVRTAYGLPAKEPQPFVLPDKAAYLNPKQQRAILAMIDAFLEGNGPRGK